MPEGVACDAFWDSAFVGSDADLTGHGVVVDVVAGDPSGAWVRAEGRVDAPEEMMGVPIGI